MYIFKAAALHFMDFMWLLKCAIKIRQYRALEHLEKELVGGPRFMRSFVSF